MCLRASRVKALWSHFLIGIINIKSRGVLLYVYAFFPLVLLRGLDTKCDPEIPFSPYKKPGLLEEMTDSRSGSQKAIKDH